jgi:hypothetical protein
MGIIEYNSGEKAINTKDRSYIFDLTRRNGELFVVDGFGDTHNPLGPESFTIAYHDNEDKFSIAVVYNIEILDELIKQLQKTSGEYVKMTTKKLKKISR